MLLTNKEVNIMNFIFDYDFTFKGWMQVFPSVFKGKIEVEPSVCRCYHTSGHIDIRYTELPDAIRCKIQRHLRIV
jgi:hypothetical protein